MDISFLELRELLKPASSHSMKVGESYLIRTVTMFYTGRVLQITDTDLLLEDAAWIVDTGRFSECLKTGELSEVEPFVDVVVVPRAVIVDATLWRHPLPREVK